MKRIIILVVIVGMAGYAFAAGVPQTRPDEQQYCFDFTKTLSNNLVREINNQGSGLRRAFDIDFLVVMVPSLEGRDVLDYTVDLFSKWEVGKNTKGKKGLMILIALAEQKVRIEVGYDLEGIYPDAFVGQVEREILKEILEQANWDIGFLATIESFLYRLYNKDLTEEVKSIESPDDQLEFYSEGAGASTFFDFGAAAKKPLPKNNAELQAYFSAQPTPRMAFERYLEHLAKNVSTYDLGLMTKESRIFFKTHPTSSGQRRAERSDVDGLGYYVKQKGDHAVVMFVESNNKETIKAGVYFIRKTQDGWQMDFNTMTRSLRVVGPGWVLMTERYHAYTEIIMQEYNLSRGFFKRWDDPSGLVPFYRYGSRSDDNKSKGCKISLWDEYKEVGNLKQGDVIFSVNGNKINNFNQLKSYFQNPIAGTTFTFNIRRNGWPMVVKETLLGYPDGYHIYKKHTQIPRTWIGVYMSQSTDREWNITRKMRDQGRFRYSSLCSILEVAPGSPADKAGLKPMDLVLHYGVPDNNGEIMSYDIVEYLNKVKPGETIELTILRDEKNIMKLKITTEETWSKEYF